MNRNRLVFPSFKLALFMVLFLGVATTAYAANKDCWADFFDEAQYAGKHLLIEDTAQFVDLSNINGENWDRRIHSLKVGPQGESHCFPEPAF